MRMKANGITPGLLTAAPKEIPWHIISGVEGVGQVSRVVAECVCFAKPMAEEMDG